MGIQLVSERCPTEDS